MFYETAKNDHGLPVAPFKSCAVPRAIAWLSTLSADGVANLAPFSQFTNLTFDPPYVLVAVNQDTNNRRKDTTVNIETTGEFVYNMVTWDLREAMNITAVAFPSDVDEFERAGLTKAPSVLVKPWRVAESPVQMECRYVQTIRLPGDGMVGTVDVIIGKVVGIHISDDALTADGKIDIEKIRPLARLGYSDYTVVERAITMLPSDIEESPDAIQGLSGNTGYFTKK
jgi:flavin reductase (DIM6/NTAB) family NADH-FMN oxidoreductase RutF